MEHQIQRVRSELVVLKEEFTALPPEQIKALLLMGDEDYDRVKRAFARSSRRSRGMSGSARSESTS